MPTPPPQRPGQPPGWRGRGTPPPDPATQRLQRPRPPDAPTEQFHAPTQQIRASYRPGDVAATEKFARPRPGGGPSVPPPVAPVSKPPSRFGGLKAIVLILVIGLALVAGGLVGAELYARHRADTILVAVAECVVEDTATISFGVNPPFLWQHITGHYTDISVETGGRQVQAAKGMTADVTLKDIRLQGTADSKGTIGSLDATLAWTSDGIKETVVDNLPLIGSLVTGVHTDTAAGTIVIEAAGGNSVTAQPVVTDGDLGLRVLDLTGPLSKDTVQTALDELTKKLNDNYPLGIHADSVEVTETGVVGKFSSQDASIPNGQANSCFEGI